MEQGVLHNINGQPILYKGQLNNGDSVYRKRWSVGRADILPAKIKSIKGIKANLQYNNTAYTIPIFFIRGRGWIWEYRREYTI